MVLTLRGAILAIIRVKKALVDNVKIDSIHGWALIFLTPDTARKEEKEIILER